MAASLPQHLAGPKPTLDPYGHLIRMLVPRASGIGFYDAHGMPLWVSDDYDGPDPQPVVEEAIAKAPAATTAVIDGFSAISRGRPPTRSGCTTNSGRSSAWQR
jgi:hypothetical protein